MMNTYQIRDKESGYNLGNATGIDESHALAGLARRAGFGSFREWAKALGRTEEHARAMLDVSCVRTAEDDLQEILDTEIKLSRLLGYTKIDMPGVKDANAFFFGIPTGGEHGGDPRLARGLIPRWRRDASAMGDLLERLPINVRRYEEGVDVWVDGPVGTVHQTAKWDQFDTAGMAIRKAMVGACIDYLVMVRGE